MKLMFSLALVLLLLFSMFFLSIASATGYVQAGQGKYVEYKASTFIKEVGVNINGSGPSWGNFTLNLTLASIVYSKDYTEMNVTANATPTSGNFSFPTLPYYLVNISSEKNSLYGFLGLFLYPIAVPVGIWPQVNNTTLLRLNNETFGTLELIGEVPFDNNSAQRGLMNVPTPIREDGKTLFSFNKESVKTDRLVLTQYYSNNGSYSNSSTEFLIDTNTGVMVHASQHSKLLKADSYVAQNGTTVYQKLYQFYNFTMVLAKTNFPIAYNSTSYNLYITLGVASVIVSSIAAFLTFRYRRNRERS